MKESKSKDMSDIEKNKQIKDECKTISLLNRNQKNRK